MTKSNEVLILNGFTTPVRVSVSSHPITNKRRFQITSRILKKLGYK
jgi:hypothetical protein